MSRPRRPTTDQRIASAVRRLASERSVDTINLSELAREAGVSWPTVKRHVGDRRRLRELAESDVADPGRGGPDARSRLLDAAQRVFARRGFASATLDEIAAEAGLTKGALYWHFESKTDLFVTLFDESSQHAEPHEPFVVRGDADQAVYRLLSQALGRAQSSREHAKLLLEFAAALREPAIAERTSAVLRARLDRASTALRELQAERVLDPELDPDQAASLLAAAAAGLILLALADPELDLAAALPEMARMLARGLGTPVRR